MTENMDKDEKFSDFSRNIKPPWKLLLKVIFYFFPLENIF